MTYYEILEVTPTASEDMIHMAYKVMMNRYNPDTYPGNREIAERRMVAINKAYKVLSDPEIRKRYDLYLQNREQGGSNQPMVTKTNQTASTSMPKMKYCTHCGQPIEEDARVCLKCGTQVILYTSSVSNSGVREAPMKTDRSLLKTLLFTLFTFGIYPLVLYSKIGCEINTIASPYDGKKTMHYCWVVFVFSWLTCWIVPMVWMHRLAKRIGSELDRRNIEYEFGASTLWLWCLLGSLIIVGPFVYIHKLLTAMNLLAADYNEKGA